MSAEPAVHGRFVRTAVALSATISLLVAAGSAYGYITYNQATNTGTGGCFSSAGCPTSPGGKPSPSDTLAAKAIGGCAPTSCNFLLLGTDSRAGLPPSQLNAFGTNGQASAGHNSDVIMVVHTEVGGKTVILSFPRDLWVHIPGHGVGKINSSYAFGGPEEVAKTIYKLTGLKISHYLYVNLAGFEGVVSTLGGVDMCIPPVDVNSSDGYINDPLTLLHIKPGCQRLPALQALAYVRSRHLPCDINGDFNRIGRQQQFMRAIINRMLQPSELVRLPSLIQPLLRNMERDSGLSVADLAYLVGQLKGISTGNVLFRDVPSTPAVIHVPYTLDIVREDKVPAEKLFKALRDNSQLPGTVGTSLSYTPPSEANIVIPVVDHGSGGTTDGVEQILNLGGFDTSPGVVPYTSFGANVKGTVLAVTPGDLPSAEAAVIQRYFPNIKIKNVKAGSLGQYKEALFITSSYKPVPVGSGVQFSACLPPAP